MGESKLSGYVTKVLKYFVIGLFKQSFVALCKVPYIKVTESSFNNVG